MEKRYNIGYLMHGARNVGGGEYSIYNLIRNLRRPLFSPIVLYAHENEIIARLRDEGIPVVAVPLDEKITAVYRDAVGRDPASLIRYARGLSAGIAAVSGKIRELGIDLLHPHDNLSKLIGARAARCTKIPVVCHCRDLLREGFVERALLVFQLLFMDRVIAVSEGNRRLFRVLGRIPDKVRTIHNGLDLSAFDPAKPAAWSRSAMGIAESDFVVGIIGVFDRIKGHTHLFEALQKMAAGGRGAFRCLVVGDGREWDSIHRDVRDRGISDRVRFLGYRTDIADLLRLMDVVVLPSLQESFPRVPLEAMAMGLPVVATTVGGIPESVSDGETGILVPPGDGAAIRDALVRLGDDPALRKRMGETGRRRVREQFSIEANIARTEALYLEVFQAGGH